MQRIILISWFLWYLKEILVNEGSHEVQSYPMIYTKSIQLITSDKIERTKYLEMQFFFQTAARDSDYHFLLDFYSSLCAEFQQNCFFFFCRIHYVCVAKNHSYVWKLWWVFPFILCYCTLLFLFTQTLLNYLFSDYWLLVDCGFTWSLDWNNHS